MVKDLTSLCLWYGNKMSSFSSYRNVSSIDTTVLFSYHTYSSGISLHL